MLNDFIVMYVLNKYYIIFMGGGIYSNTAQQNIQKKKKIVSLLYIESFIMVTVIYYR